MQFFSGLSICLTFMTKARGGYGIASTNNIKKKTHHAMTQLCTRNSHMSDQRNFCATDVMLHIALMGYSHTWQ